MQAVVGGVLTGAWSVTPRDQSDVTVTDRDATLSHYVRDVTTSDINSVIVDLHVPYAADESASTHYNIASPATCNWLSNVNSDTDKK